MKNKGYTREELLDILLSYRRMIDHNFKNHPEVCLLDLYASITWVLERNGLCFGKIGSEEK